jgi:hypothetical protein
VTAYTPTISGSGDPYRIPAFQRTINRWRRQVAADRTLTASQREFLRELAGRPFGGRATLHVWWVQDAICEHYGVTRSTVFRWIKSAMDRGYIAIVVKGRKHRAQVYRLKFPDPPQPAETPSQGCTDAAPVVRETSVPGGSAPPSPAAADAPRRRGQRQWRPRREPRRVRAHDFTAAALASIYANMRRRQGLWFDGSDGTVATDSEYNLFKVLHRALMEGDDPEVLRRGLKHLFIEQMNGRYGIDWSVTRRRVLRASARAQVSRG